MTFRASMKNQFRAERSLITVEQISNPFPPFLYKYRTGLEIHLNRTIVHSELFFSHRDDFNDPFDTHCKITYDGTGAERRERFKRFVASNKMTFKKRMEMWGRLSDPVKAEKMAQDSFDEIATYTGIHSLAETPRSLLMWAHYADEHKGICLQYYLPADVPLFRESFTVEYAVDFPTVNWVTK